MINSTEMIIRLKRMKNIFIYLFSTLCWGSLMLNYCINVTWRQLACGTGEVYWRTGCFDSSLPRVCIVLLGHRLLDNTPYILSAVNSNADQSSAVISWSVNKLVVVLVWACAKSCWSQHLHKTWQEMEALGALKSPSRHYVDFGFDKTDCEHFTLKWMLFSLDSSDLMQQEVGMSHEE